MITRLKYLIIILLFYFFALLQNSFFPHFDLFGATPNLIFIMFFALLFFSARGEPALGWKNIFYAVSAGLFLDIFSYRYLGASALLLLFIGFFVKKAQGQLQEKKNNSFPFIYFLPLFLFAFLAYDLLLKFSPNLKGFAAEIVYNLFIASVGFYVCKKFLKFGIDNPQLNLFNK